MNDRKRWSLTAILLALTLILSSSTGHLNAFANTDEETELDSVEIVVAEPNLPPEPTAAELAAKEAEKKKQSYQAQIDAINKNLAALEGEQDKIKQNISSAKSEADQKQLEVNSIGNQISNTQYEINLMQEKIYLLELDIQDKEATIEEKEAEYDKNYALFLKRFRAMSMHNTGSSLGLIIGSDSYVDFLTTNDTLNRIAKHDNEVMNTLLKEKIALEKNKEELEGSQDSLESTRSVTEVKKLDLAGQQMSVIDEVQSLNTLASQFEAELSQSIAKSASMKAEIDNIYQQIKMSTNPYVGGVMQWPVPNFSQITSSYGWRFNNQDYHTGMDISGGGVLGAPVVAANDATVVHTNWSHSSGVGYGIYVILDHGGGTSTLYAHLSNISVQVGQTVKQGETIGAVGNTGWSTGPHLHFEVRENGGHVNPYGYVTGG